MFKWGFSETDNTLRRFGCCISGDSVTSLSVRRSRLDASCSNDALESIACRFGI